MKEYIYQRCMQMVKQQITVHSTYQIFLKLTLPVNPGGDTSGVQISPLDGETEVLGKTVNELQENIAINKNNEITGKLKYVTDFIEFNKSVKEEQKGNFIAIKVEEATQGKTVTGQLAGTGTKNGKPVKLTDDGIFICKVANNDNTIKITVDGENERTLTLTKVELEQNQ